jgi:hypothetical protein
LFLVLFIFSWIILTDDVTHTHTYTHITIYDHQWSPSTVNRFTIKSLQQTTIGIHNSLVCKHPVVSYSLKNKNKLPSRINFMARFDSLANRLMRRMGA